MVGEKWVGTGEHSDRDSDSESLRALVGGLGKFSLNMMVKIVNIAMVTFVIKSVIKSVRKLFLRDPMSPNFSEGKVISKGACNGTEICEWYLRRCERSMEQRNIKSTKSL